MLYLTGLIAGFVGGMVAYYLSNKFLNKPIQNSMIKHSAPPVRSRNGKLIPRAPSELTAYLKELEQEGQNRG